MTISNRRNSFLRRIAGAELFTIIVLLVAGTVACFWIPVGAGFDEDQHLLRVWEISAFHFIPNEWLSTGQSHYPSIFNEMSIRHRIYGRVIEPDFWSEYSQLHFDAFDHVHGALYTTSTYSPALFLPQALVMRYLGRRANLPALPVFYASRLVGLLIYILLAWLAVRLMPVGKWTLAILAVAPMAVFQAATINADTISNGIGLLFISGCLSLNLRQQIRWREWGILTCLITLLLLAKVNLIFLLVLPFLILSPARFKMKGGYAFLVIASLILVLVEVGGWNVLAFSHAKSVFPGADPIGQIKFIASHPWQFLNTVLQDLWSNKQPYTRQWFGVYGYGYWSVPFITYIFYALCLVSMLFIKPSGETFSKKLRLYLGLVFLLGYLTTVGILYLTYTPVGSASILGVQGRYLIPVMPLLFLALSGLPGIRNQRLLRWLTAGSAAFGLTCFGMGLLLSYHITCGTQFYQWGLCYEPIYKKWQPNASYSPPLSSETPLSQSFIAECDGITQIRVWVDAQGASSNATTDFIFWDPNHALTLVKASILDRDLPQGGWVSLSFSPLWNSNGMTYDLMIHSGDSQGNPGPRIATSTEIVNTVGSLSMGGKAESQNLVYQYACLAGLEKIWWSIHP
ncbi:MAG: DUF2142 domain-containing protein [Anaerolineales bacterium]|jgi:hypothetical protein